MARLLSKHVYAEVQDFKVRFYTYPFYYEGLGSVWSPYAHVHHHRYGDKNVT